MPDTVEKKSSPLQGSSYSLYEVGVLTSNVSNKDLVLASYNPLVEMLTSTLTQTTFSKPFYPTVYKQNGEIDEEVTKKITANFENIDFYTWAQVAQADAFNLGIGPAELGYSYNEETKFFEFVSMERRPPDTFIQPIKKGMISTSQRWKGIYFEKGVRQFDQTTYGDKKGTVKLNTDQMFYVLPTSAKYSDGPGHLDYLISMLDGCQTSFGLIFQVMANQIDPEEITIENDIATNSTTVVEKFVQQNNSFDTVPIPTGMTVNHPHYYDKKDILGFFKFFENMLYKITFPTSALSSEGGGLLDASSSYAKEDLFFSYIDFWRYKEVRGANRIGKFWLDLNGYAKQGYYFKLVAPPVTPRNLETEQKIMLESLKSGGISANEFRGWLNSAVNGLELEEEYEQVGAQAEMTLTGNDYMVKASKLDNLAKSKALQEVMQDELSDIEKVWEEVAKKMGQ